MLNWEIIAEDFDSFARSRYMYRGPFKSSVIV